MKAFIAHAALAALACGAPTRAGELLPPGAAPMNDNGGWSWFEGERAVVDPAAGKLLFSSVADGAGPGGAQRRR